MYIYVQIIYSVLTLVNHAEDYRTYYHLIYSE